jgi:DNA-binding NtrC family response regulator
LPPSLIASELFGHEKGSFTGAVARKIGRIEAAHKGTVFLDEIGDMPLEMQAHLLRFVQERQIERVGGTKPISVDVRVIAATNTNLEEAVAKGRFRDDLYYRLNELPLAMPALRERGDDILLLAKFFLRKFATEMGREIEGFEAAAERAIMTYAWPGNVRELIASVRRAVVISDGGAITDDELGLSQPSLPVPQGNPGSLGEVRAKTEGQLIRETLKAKGYNVTRAAAALGISRVTLYRLLEKYDIETKRRANRALRPAAAAAERALESAEAAD